MMNPRVTSLNRSSTLKITALTKKLKKEGKDVVNFAAGEPDFDTPDFIKQGAKEAIDSGFTKYTPSTGILDLKQSLAEKLNNENSLSVGPGNIIVTTGAKYSLFVAIFGLLSPGDEVILPAPFWVSYPEMIKLAGATVKKLSTTKENDFKILPDDLKAAITSKTKLLILNYPANPTGATYSREELEAIWEIVKGKDIFVLSDEIYEKLLYDGQTHVSFASLAGADKQTLTVNGFSKSSAMTGWRLGYLVGPQDFISEVTKIVDHTTSCACSVSQKAALAALKDKKWQTDMVKEFELRRNLLFGGLTECDKITPVKPKGAFYMFCDITETGLSSFDFCSQLLNKELVSCIPADGFGAEGFVRMSFATSTESIQKGIDRIKKFVSEL
ncbi:MAG: pyridoxal phosphate-dependent aminotransferase [Candidatus Omnitrophica bacterium]|nr:pyridoxal phosphate-dependent aminotransferase [Candidatus Omnitrophota bacterium]